MCDRGHAVHIYEATMSEYTLPTIADVLHAAKTIAPYLDPTPLHHHLMLDELLGAEVYLKHENYQPIGAFKVRGGINFVAHMDEDARRRGIVTASTGNHGQSVAYAARLFGVRAVIVAPENANAVKVAAMQALGAEVVLHGPDFEASKRYCATLVEEQGLYFLSSGDEPLLVAGVGTHTLEILQQQPDIDYLFVPVGGGSGAAGAALVAHTLTPNVRVIGVAASGAPAGYLTWRDGKPVTRPIHTFAGGLATGEPFMMPQEILRGKLHDFVLVDDEEMMVAVRLLLEKAKTLAEPAGASTLAAALQMKAELAGKKVALILSGGNISPEELELCLQQTQS